MKIYSHDVKIWGTAYVLAQNEAEARRKLDDFLGTFIEVDGENISGDRFEHLESEISLSPMMTIDQKQELGSMDEVW